MNVIKVFVFFGISTENSSYGYFHILQCTKLTVFFNPSLSSQMSLTVISVDNSNVAGGEQRGRLATNNDC